MPQSLTKVEALGIGDWGCPKNMENDGKTGIFHYAYVSVSSSSFMLIAER